jgi:hypothetical protein
LCPDDGQDRELIALEGNPVFRANPLDSPVKFSVAPWLEVTERKVSKLAIAHEYLDAAIEFFLARTNFFCAINLTAAAEELFGAHLSWGDWLGAGRIASRLANSDGSRTAGARTAC